jgi:hypothetical protein
MKTRTSTLTLWLFACLASSCQVGLGGGITADVGLTPPVDRWIFRTQLRYMERGDDPSGMDREVQMFAAPMVLAYGLRPNVTVIARQLAFHRRLRGANGTTDETGFGDFTVISKWRLVRINRPKYIIGIAPTLGVELPTGDDEFGSDTWDGLGGAYVTARRGPWGADLNLEYALNGMDDRDGDDQRSGDVFTANAAFSYQFTLDDDATLALWPVLELTYTDTQPDQRGGSELSDSGGRLLTMSPGLRFARQSFMLEALVQIPVSQEQHGEQLERGFGALAGLRYLF